MSGTGNLHEHLISSHESKFDQLFSKVNKAVTKDQLKEELIPVIKKVNNSISWPPFIAIMCAILGGYFMLFGLIYSDMSSFKSSTQERLFSMSSINNSELSKLSNRETKSEERINKSEEMQKQLYDQLRIMNTLLAKKESYFNMDKHGGTQ
jgi:hypothetical protein